MSQWISFSIRSLIATVLPLIATYLLYEFYKHKRVKSLLSKNSLRDKVILITGASGGLGEALAKELFERGSRLILCARSLPQLERVKNELMQRFVRNENHEPIVLQLDLSDITLMQSACEKALQCYGYIDILINNAGVSHRGNALQTDIKVDQQIMLVNYFGQIALTKAVLPSMIARNSGQIVVISSIQGRLAIPFRSAYSASKHALQAFFDTLRAELVDTNILVSVISPGYIKTNISLNALTGTGAQYGILDKSTETGLDADKAAQTIVMSIICKDNELLLSPIAPKLAIILRAICPNIIFYLMRRRAKKFYESSNTK